MDKKYLGEKIKGHLSKYTKIQMTVSLVVIILLALFIYGANRKLNTLSNGLTIIENKLASTTEELQGRINMSHNTLTSALNLERQNIENIGQTLGTYKQEVGSVSSTVNTLQKLSKTDPQLLAKYSKVFFLNENYAPARLAEIPMPYRYSEQKPLKLNAEVWPYLQRMMDDASKSASFLTVLSAYRSFDEQKALKGEYTVTYGAGTANSFSADQGYSEHQLGTTVDLSTPFLKGTLDRFENSQEYEWLLANAHRYGFILSYPKNNKFYVYEPWHWRFVGVKLAIDLHNQNKNFYDMDQRDIDVYLVNLFD